MKPSNIVKAISLAAAIVGATAMHAARAEMNSSAAPATATPGAAATTSAKPAVPYRYAPAGARPVTPSTGAASVAKPAAPYAIPARQMMPGAAAAQASKPKSVAKNVAKPGKAAAMAGPVNINTADANALAASLDGVGPAKAAAIVAYRAKHGAFTSADQLADVKGIGKATIDKNRAHILLR